MFSFDQLGAKDSIHKARKALTTFRGGIIMIEPKTDFVERICNEKWLLEECSCQVVGVEQTSCPGISRCTAGLPTAKHRRMES